MFQNNPNNQNPTQPTNQQAPPPQQQQQPPPQQQQSPQTQAPHMYHNQPIMTSAQPTPTQPIIGRLLFLRNIVIFKVRGIACEKFLHELFSKVTTHNNLHCWHKVLILRYTFLPYEPSKKCFGSCRWFSIIIGLATKFVPFFFVIISYKARMIYARALYGNFKV